MTCADLPKLCGGGKLVVEKTRSTPLLWPIEDKDQDTILSFLLLRPSTISLLQKQLHPKQRSICRAP